MKRQAGPALPTRPIILGVILGLFAVGATWAWIRGGSDFRAFHYAFEQVSQGQVSSIYVFSTDHDRYLYAPGFAMILVPLGYLNEAQGLGLWQLFQAMALALLVWNLYQLCRWAGLQGSRADWAVLGGILYGARALLIDLQYGQINLIILALSLNALRTFYYDPRRGVNFLSWAGLGVAAVAKVYPAPLLLLPLIHSLSPSLRKRGVRRPSDYAMAGAALGVALVLVMPFLILGLSEGFSIHRAWLGALGAKGLPLESHNQSWVAGCMRWLTSEPVHVFGWGYNLKPLGIGLLPSVHAKELGAGLSLLSFSVLLRKLTTLHHTAPQVQELGLLLILLVLPGYLVWKPYFLFCIPAGAAWVGRWMQQPAPRKWAAGILAFSLLNLSGIDILGSWLGGRLEAASSMLLGAVVLVSQLL